MGGGGLESSAGILAEAPPIQAEVLLERLGGVVLVVNELDLEGQTPRLYNVSDDEVGSEEMRKRQIGKYIQYACNFRQRAHESPGLQG